MVVPLIPGLRCFDALPTPAAEAGRGGGSRISYYISLSDSGSLTGVYAWLYTVRHWLCTSTLFKRGGVYGADIGCVLVHYVDVVALHGQTLMARDEVVSSPGFTCGAGTCSFFFFFVHPLDFRPDY